MNLTRLAPRAGLTYEPPGGHRFAWVTLDGRRLSLADRIDGGGFSTSPAWACDAAEIERIGASRGASRRVL
jgi:hypothetical protein